MSDRGHGFRHRATGGRYRWRFRAWRRRSRTASFRKPSGPWPERPRTSSGRPRAELGQPKRCDHGQSQPPRQSEPDADSDALAISAPMIRRRRLLCQCRPVHGAVLTREIVPNVQLRPAAPWTQGQATNSCAAHQDLLLVGRCRAVLRLDLLQQLDGGEMVGGAQAPGGGQASIAGELVVGREGRARSRLGRVSAGSCIRRAILRCYCCVKP